MAERDLVSIVIPVYNLQDYLERCIRSIQGQSYENLEIILVDDGSTDGSLALCRREAEGDARIRVIHKENGGVASARNAGMDVMTGQWLLLIDGDDYIHPHMVRDLLTAVQEEKAQAAVCGFQRVFADGAPPEVHSLERQSEKGARSDLLVVDGEKRELLTGSWWKVSDSGAVSWSGTLHEFSEAMFLPLYRNLMLRTQSNKLYSVPLIRQHHLAYPEGYSINEDIWFCVRYLTFCRRIACIPGSYLYYWQNDAGGSQISRYHPEGVKSCFLLLSAVKRFLKAAGSSKPVCREMDNEMLFHICGFAGHIYYRTLASRRECYESICELADRKELRYLLMKMKPKGMKNRVAAFLLGNHMCSLYHGMCLALYGKQRRLYRKACKKQQPGRWLTAAKIWNQNAREPGEKENRDEKKGIAELIKKEAKKKRMAGGNASERKAEHRSDEILVSISCITFNHEAYIARALDSFLMQKTNFKYEILVYDDASTDRTQEIIREYEQKYPDIIKPYYQTENQYSQGKYNVEGFFNYPRAKGKYIAMCDGDDYWTDEKKLQLQVDYMEKHPECAMCLHAARIETQERAIQSLKIRPYKKNRLISAEEVIDKPSNYPTASLLFRTEYTKDLQDYYYISPVGDIPIQIHMAAKGTVYYMDRKMSVYQQGVSVSWSALMKQGNYKQNLIDHHNAMKVMYRGFSKETHGKYDKAIQRACRRMDFLTLINVKEYKEALAPGYRSFYRELDLRTRFFIRFELMAPGLYRALRKLVFGKDRC